MRDNDMLLQENLNTVDSGVKALSILSKILQGKDGGASTKKDDASMESVLRKLSVALLSSQKNNLDTPSHSTTKQTETYDIRNIINSSECFSTEGNDIDITSPMSTDSEPRDSDDQAKPEIDYEEELLSRKKYYYQYEISEAATPKSKKNTVPASTSTPLASSTLIKDCSTSTLRNTRRIEHRSTPLASSTMMEDLIDDVQQQHHDTCAASPGSVVTWSIDNSTNTASLKDFYNIYFGIDSEVTLTDFRNRNGHLPRSSTCINLCKMTDNHSQINNCQKKNSKCRQPVSKLLIFIRGIKRNLSRRPFSTNSKR